MNRDVLDDLGRLLLRLLVGGLMLFHGVSKISHGVGAIHRDVAAHGLPSFVAYGVYLGEVLAPLFIVLGVFTRAAAVVEAIDLVFAVGMVHMADIAHISRTGGYALELQAFYFIGAIAVALLGAGRYSAGGARGRLN